MSTFETVVIRGIATMNFELTIEPDVFVAECSNLGLDANNFKSFTEDQWLMLRKALKDTVFDNESDIEFVELHNSESISVDEVTIQDDDISVVTYEIGDKVYSIEIDV